MNSDLYVGHIASKYLNGADVSYFISLIVSVFVYMVIVNFKDNRGEIWYRDARIK